MSATNHVPPPGRRVSLRTSTLDATAASNAAADPSIAGLGNHVRYPIRRRGRGRPRGSSHRAPPLGPSGRPLKIKFKGAGGGGGGGGGGGSGSGGGLSNNQATTLAGFMQGYDRDVDSDPDEPLNFEEHFILRMPGPSQETSNGSGGGGGRMKPDPFTERLREMVNKRTLGSKKPADGSNGGEIPEEVWFKFKDSRRAVFGMGDKMWKSRLVDLPCVIESQKTTDGRHLYKVADISQMLLVDTPISDESEVVGGSSFDPSSQSQSQPADLSSDGPSSSQHQQSQSSSSLAPPLQTHDTRGGPNININDYIYPHGITPPMRFVRKRRFKKRVNKRTVEAVEKAVEKLLEDDAKAEKVEYELIDDFSDSEFEDNSANQVQGEDEGEYDAVGGEGEYDNEGVGVGEGGEEGLGGEAADGEGEGEGEEDNDFDADLAAEIDKGLAELDEEDEVPSGGVGADGTTTQGTAERKTSGQGGKKDGIAAASSDDDFGGGAQEDDLFGSGDEIEYDENGNPIYYEEYEEEEEEESDEDDDDDDDEEEDEATAEERKKVEMLKEEVKDLEMAVNKKRAEVARAQNIILKKRFEEAARKLSSELDLKKSQLFSTTESRTKRRQMRKEQLERRAEREKQKGKEKEGREVGNAAGGVQGGAARSAMGPGSTGQSSSQPGGSMLLSGMPNTIMEAPGDAATPSTPMDLDGPLSPSDNFNLVPPPNRNPLPSHGEIPSHRRETDEDSLGMGMGMGMYRMMQQEMIMEDEENRMRETDLAVPSPFGVGGQDQDHEHEDPGIPIMMSPTDTRDDGGGDMQTLEVPVMDVQVVDSRTPRDY